MNTSKSIKPFKEYIAITLILVFCFAIRIYYLVVTSPQPPLIYDAQHYDVMTRQLLDKGILGYASVKPNAFTTPGYPLFLAVIYKIFGYAGGSPLTQVRVIQIILATLTIWLLYLLAKHIANARVGLFAAFFASIYLVFLWVPTLILTETLYTFLFMLYLYLQFLAIDRKSNLMNFLTGLALAAAVLVRPAIAPLIVLPYIYYYLITKDKSLLKGFIMNAAGFILLMLPWWVRNLIVLKKFILFATQEDPLLRGTYPYEIGIENIPYTNQKQEAIKRIVEGFTKQPLLYLKWYTIGKFDYLYFKIFYYVDERITTLRWLLPLHNFFIWFGWVGVAFSVIKKEIRLISLYILLITAIQLVFTVTSRYAYPVIHLLILLTAYIIDLLFFGSKKEAKAA